MQNAMLLLTGFYGIIISTLNNQPVINYVVFGPQKTGFHAEKT